MSIKSIIKARMNEHYEDALEKWNESVPEALQGFDIDELIENQWNGKLTKANTRKFIKYLDDPTQFLILYGPSGLGKTVMGVEVCERFLEKKTVGSAIYVDTPTLLSELSTPTPGFSPVDYYSKPDILLLDDMGASTTEMTSVRKSGLWAIINRRWMHGKKTIISTNLPPTQSGDNPLEVSLKDYLGDSSWDRVISSYTLLVFSGKSMRNARNSRRGGSRGKTDFL